MLVLVDVQYVTSSRVTHRIFGVYNTEDDSLYYYKQTELQKEYKKAEKAGKSLKIKGIFDIFDRQRGYTIYRMDGIEFITERNNSYLSNTLTYNDGKKDICYSLPGIETIYTKPMKIARYTSCLTVWYQGIRFQWKDIDKQQNCVKRLAGFNVENTIGWKATKNYFYTNRLLKPVTLQGEQFVQNTWPAFMTQEHFTSVLNNFQQYYIVTSFYRTQLPFCKELDFSHINTSNISSLRNCFWHNNSLERVNLEGLNLDKILDFYWGFTDDKKLKYVDFRGCRGDLQIGDMIINGAPLLNLEKLGKETCLILTKQQVKFIQALRNRTYIKELGTVTSVADIEDKKKYVVASSKLMTGKIPNSFFVVV